MAECDRGVNGRTSCVGRGVVFSATAKGVARFDRRDGIWLVFEQVLFFEAFDPVGYPLYRDDFVPQLVAVRKLRADARTQTRRRPQAPAVFLEE